MIEETARVIDVRDSKVLLETERKSTCQSCSVKAGCGTSTLAKVVGRRSSQFVVDNTLGVQVGDQVIVAVEESALVQGSLLMYLMPLLFMFALGIIGEYLFASELLTVLTSLLGLALGMLVVRYVLLQSRLKSSIQPHLVRRVL